jgi:ABC-type glycerol-3-phosphate transport system permease component
MMADITLDQPIHRRINIHRLRKSLGRLVSHILVFTIGLFFLVPALWMVFTAFKTDKDVFRFPPTLLPQDNLMVEVNGEQLPVYKVPVENSIRELALLDISEGQGTFVDPQNPTETIQVRMRET